MVARHPHVFGDVDVAGAEEVLRNWEHQKAEEAARQGRAHETVLDGVPRNLPALAWTANMQKRAARIGFDLPAQAGAAQNVAEQAASLADVEPGNEAFSAIGELLLKVVALSKTLDVNPEDALRAAGQRYRHQFARMDDRVRAQGLSYRDLEPEKLQSLWDEE
jgi:uncharacterized protein YabN with tetrapyrrole methylase and pyrophosphatase domain